MNKLSKREKVMIYVMVLCLIAGGGVLVIRELNKTYQTASDQLTNSQMEKEALTLELTRLDTIEADIKKKQTFYDEHKKAFDSPLKDEALEKKIMDFLDDYHLKMDSTQITASQNEETSDSIKLTQAQSEDEVQLVDQATGGAAEGNADASTDGSTDGETSEETENTEETQNVGPEYITGTLTVSTRGTFKNFCNFIQKADDDLRINVSSYQIYDEDDYIVFQTNSNATYTYNMTINYYMMQK